MRNLLTTILILFASTALAEPNAGQRAKLAGLSLDVSLENAAKDEGRAMALIEIAPGFSCGYPHQGDSDIAFAPIEVLIETLDLTEADAVIARKVHRSALATGSGSYPPGCNPKWPGVHAINWRVNSDTFNATSKRPLTDEEFAEIIASKVWGPSGDPHGRPFTMAELKKHWGGKPMWQVLMDFTAEANRRIGIIQTPILTRGPPINISVLSRPIPGSTIGIGWFPGSDPCPGDHVEFHIDSGYRAGFQGQFGLWLHENGHCLKLQHQFNGQDRHQGPMSYRFNNHPVYGWVTADMVDLVGLPVSPSVAVLTRLYGGKPVGVPWAGKFADEPTVPTDPPPTGSGNGWTVGQLVTLSDGVKTYKLKVMSEDGDEGETLADKITAELAKVNYANKDQHRGTLAALYESLSRAVREEKVSVADAVQTIQLMRGWLIGSDIDKWADVLKLADSVTTLAGLESVAKGLGAAAGFDLTDQQLAEAVVRIQADLAGQGLDPKIVAIIELILPFLPAKIQIVARIVLMILKGLPAKEAIHPVGPAQKPLQGLPRIPPADAGTRYNPQPPRKSSRRPFGVAAAVATIDYTEKPR